MQGAMDISPESWYLLAGDALSPPSFRGLSSVWGTNRQHCFICLDPVPQETPTKTTANAGAIRKKSHMGMFNVDLINFHTRYTHTHINSKLEEYACLPIKWYANYSNNQYMTNKQYVN